MVKQRPAAALAPLASIYRNLDDIVLASTPLRADADRDGLSRFGDDLWDMNPGVFQARAYCKMNMLDFSTIGCPVEQLTAKEYIFASLNVRAGERYGRLRPSSARNALQQLQRFMGYVRERHGRFDTALIDQETIDDYRVMLLATTSGGRRSFARYLKPIVELRRFAAYLTCGGLAFTPWGGRTIYRVAGCNGPKPGENRTPRIPEPVIGALLHWSLKYIELYSVDIFAARAELTTLQAKRAARPHLRPRTDVLARVNAWLDERRRSARGGPVWENPNRTGVAPALSRATPLRGEVINLRLITFQIDVNMQSVQENSKAYDLIRQAAIELGVERGGMDTPISIDPDTGRPWRGRFDAHSLVEEEVNLQTAAYILCAYLSGMRDGEVQAMRPGAVARSCSADGMIERLAVRSTVFKDRGTRGEAAEWITIAPVDRAVAIAERLAAHHRRHRGEDELWLVLNGHNETSGRGIPHIVAQINRLRATIDQRYGKPDEPVFPLVEGHPWSFTTLQFRRTLAWYIANRPFGVVAGKIQYKHASVAMFDGYAGSSASGFRQEVEQERALGQLDDIVEHYEAHLRSKRLAGPAALRLTQEYDRVGRELGPFPGRIVDKGRIKAMLAHLARTLHVGHLTDCFFDPATALCLDKRNMGQRVDPLLSQCAPDRCPNSCVTMRHLPVWEASIAETDVLLRSKRLSCVQREALRRDNERKRKLIAPLKSGDAE